MMAAERRFLLPRNVENGKACSVPAVLHMKDSSSFQISLPTILPSWETIEKVIICQLICLLID